MGPLRTKAIVLRRTDYGEADRIVQFLTPEGKISVLARGVRREKSKLAAGIELLSVVDITSRRGKGELSTLTSARADVFFNAILGSYDRLQFAYLILKDMSRLTEQVTDGAFFELLAQTLEALNVPRISIASIELVYRLKIAKILGQDANLIRDTSGKKLQSDKRYQFNLVDMGFIEHPGGTFGVEHVKVLRLATVASPATIESVQGIEQYLAECLLVARATYE